MNKTRPLFLACFLLLTGLFAFNSYADEVTIEYQGGIYTGEVVGDVPNGKGTWVLPDKTKYVGEFKDGKFHGQGTYTYPDGSTYVGEYKDDKKHGQGTLTGPDGRKYVGEFKDGKPWNGTEHDKDGKITATYSEGASVLTTEQEIKELLELRKLIKAKFEELLHPKVEERDVEEDAASVAKKLGELIELEREIDIRIYELLHPKVEGKDVDEDLFLFAGTLEELIELEREMDTRIEELQQR